MSLDTALDTLIETATKTHSGATKTDAPAKNEAAPAADKPDGDETSEKRPAKVREPWPETAVHAISRRDRKLSKLEEQRKQQDSQWSDPKAIEARLSELRPKVDASVDPKDPEPELSKYNDWAKYNRDLYDWNKRRDQREEKAKQTAAPAPAAADPAKAQWVQQRTTNAVEKAKELITLDPSYANVFTQSQDIIDSYPEATQEALLKSENAALAVIVLSEEGLLEDLGDMAPRLAEKVIAQAIARGKSQLNVGGEVQTKTVSDAPMPSRRPSAPSTSGKKGKDLPEDEFRKKYGL